eukprot:CAMPEP_0114594002 /NCGR_PEP_ID=MMETSP0125-20121206/15599_1 /TAXON_ID=485358 ORGANISM="Aristerostoma sp., Strain ATCC 50986" /NCGR_SAMPLE_ID=MMETSP0125 /ASSEMBLY_ACC=CAM_ASM_000245 /LENGTH=71 /DNA_ID=CAMNT_0001793751 /DNA_START=460 /DNA_END=672 /DNA_ORIENTATION=+
MNKSGPFDVYSRVPEHEGDEEDGSEVDVLTRDCNIDVSCHSKDCGEKDGDGREMDHSVDACKVEGSMGDYV